MSHKLTRVEKVVLYVLNNINILVDKGFLPKNVWKDNIKSFKVADNRATRRALKNFEPTNDEIQVAIEGIMDEYADINKFPKTGDA